MNNNDYYTRTMQKKFSAEAVTLLKNYFSENNIEFTPQAAVKDFVETDIERFNHIFGTEFDNFSECSEYLAEIPLTYAGSTNINTIVFQY